MRISDWSSDVCSSDLRRARSRGKMAGLLYRNGRCLRIKRILADGCDLSWIGNPHQHCVDAWIERNDALRFGRCSNGLREHPKDRRSEEHTSELQSLMRISYAVFCLKKKKNTRQKKKLDVQQQRLTHNN